MNTFRLYAIGRLAFGAAAFVAPALVGRTLAGAGGATPDAKAFLRGMGGREVGLGLGLLASARMSAPVRPWLIAAVLADSSDLAGIAGAWRYMPSSKRLVGLATAGGALTAGAIVFAASPARTHSHP